MSETFIDNPQKKVVDLGKALRAIKLMDDIQAKMNRMLGTKDNLISIAVKSAIERKEPYVEIIFMLRDFAKDNKTIIQDIIGVDLTKQVLAFS